VTAGGEGVFAVGRTGGNQGDDVADLQGPCSSHQQYVFELPSLFELSGNPPQLGLGVSCALILYADGRFVMTLLFLHHRIMKNDGSAAVLGNQIIHGCRIDGVLRNKFQNILLFVRKSIALPVPLGVYGYRGKLRLPLSPFGASLFLASGKKPEGRGLDRREHLLALPNAQLAGRLHYYFGDETVAAAIELDADLVTRGEGTCHPALQKVPCADRPRILFEQYDVAG